MFAHPRFSVLLFAAITLVHLTHAAAETCRDQLLDPIKLAEDERNPAASALVQGIVSKDPSVRRRVAIAYGRIFDPRSIDALLALIDDVDTETSAHALFGLGQMGWSKDVCAGREKALSEAAARLLHSPSIDIRLRAIESIGKLFYAGAEPTLLKLLEQDSDARIQAQALYSLSQFRIVAKNRGQEKELMPLPDGSLKHVHARLEHPIAEVRRNAAFLLSQLADKRSAEPLLKAIFDSDMWTRFRAMIALGSIADPRSERVREALERSLRVERSSIVVVETLKASVKLGWNVELLELFGDKLIRDPSIHVRAAFAAALSSAPAAPMSWRARLRTDKRAYVRAQAFASEALAFKDRAIAILNEAMKDESMWVRSTAVSTSNVLEKAAREDFLAAALDDPNIQVRSNAIFTLTGVESEKIRRRIDAFFVDSTDVASRYAAYYNILQRPRDAAWLELLWAAYLKSGSLRKWAELRESIVAGLSAIENEWTTAKLLEVLSSEQSPKVAYAAWKELRRRKVDGLPNLVEPPVERSPDSGLMFERNPRLVVYTNRGSFHAELYPSEAQIHVSTIVAFAERGGYDGLPWHRVLTNFVVQGGDPDRSGWSSGDYLLRAEINPLRYERGVMGMPRSASWDSGGMQWFINHVPTPALDGLYTVFGRVTMGLSVLDRLEPGDVILKVQVIR